MDSDEGKLFIGGISWETTEEKVKDYFQNYGEVTDVVIMKDKVTGRARGFGFVVFADPAVADRALLDKHVIDGRTVEAKKAVPRDEQQNMPRSNQGGPGPAGYVRTKKIFVGGLASTVTEDDFKRYFEQFGNITDVVVMYDHATQRHRGFGFITFDSEDAVENVLQKAQHELNEKLVEVKRAVPRDQNPGTGRTSGAFAGRSGGSGAGYGQGGYSSYPAASYGSRPDSRYGATSGGRGSYPSYGTGSYGNAAYAGSGSYGPSMNGGYGTGGYSGGTGYATGPTSAYGGGSYGGAPAGGYYGTGAGGYESGAGAAGGVYGASVGARGGTWSSGGGSGYGTGGSPAGYGAGGGNVSGYGANAAWESGGPTAPDSTGAGSYGYGASDGGYGASAGGYDGSGSAYAGGYGGSGGAAGTGGYASGYGEDGYGTKGYADNSWKSGGRDSYGSVPGGSRPAVGGHGAATANSDPSGNTSSGYGGGYGAAGRQTQRGPENRFRPYPATGDHAG